MKSVYGLLVTALIVLAIVWAYNKFSGQNIAALGAAVTTNP